MALARFLCPLSQNRPVGTGERTLPRSSRAQIRAPNINFLLPDGARWRVLGGSTLTSELRSPPLPSHSSLYDFSSNKYTCISGYGRMRLQRMMYEFNVCVHLALHPHQQLRCSSWLRLVPQTGQRLRAQCDLKTYSILNLISSNPLIQIPVDGFR